MIEERREGSPVETIVGDCTIWQGSTSVDLADLILAADNDRRYGRADEHADNGRGHVPRSEIVDTPGLRPANQ